MCIIKIHVGFILEPLYFWNTYVQLDFSKPFSSISDHLTLIFPGYFLISSRDSSWNLGPKGTPQKIILKNFYNLFAEGKGNRSLQSQQLLLKYVSKCRIISSALTWLLSKEHLKIRDFLKYWRKWKTIWGSPGPTSSFCPFKPTWGYSQAGPKRFGPAWLRSLCLLHSGHVTHAKVIILRERVQTRWKSLSFWQTGDGKGSPRTKRTNLFPEKKFIENHTESFYVGPPKHLIWNGFFLVLCFFINFFHLSSHL